MIPMEFPREMTKIQTIAILLSSIIGVGVLPLPRFVAKAVGTGAPLATGFGIALALLGLILIAVLGMRFPRYSIMRYSEEILGKWAGRIGSLLIIAFFFQFTAMVSREFGEVVKSEVLNETPIEVLVMVMIIVAALSSRHDIQTFAYIHLFYVPFIVMPGFFIVLFTLQNVDVLRLQPLWGNDPSGFPKGSLTAAALFQGWFILTTIIPAMRQPKLALRASFWGMGIAGFLTLVVVIITLGIFGPEEIKLLLWPTLEWSKTADFPVLERLDAAFLIGWVAVVFTSLYSSYYLVVKGLSELFRLRDHKALAIFVCPFVFLVALLPQNVSQLYEFTGLFARLGLIVTIVYPAILLMVAWVRGKRGDRDADEQEDLSH